jgi:hypothetical protein
MEASLKDGISLPQKPPELKPNQSISSLSFRTGFVSGHDLSRAERPQTQAVTWKSGRLSAASSHPEKNPASAAAAGTLTGALYSPRVRCYYSEFVVDKYKKTK